MDNIIERGLQNTMRDSPDLEVHRNWLKINIRLTASTLEEISFIVYVLILN